MKLNGLEINFLGDSITEGCGTSGPEKTFVHILAETCKLSAARNYGIGGTRIARQHTPSDNPRIDLNFCQRALEMDPNADVVVVFGGTNDFGHGDAPFGVFEDRSADSFCGACHVLFQSLLQRYPAAKIAVITPLHRTNEANPRGDGSRTTFTPPLAEYVEAIRKTAQHYALPVLDLYGRNVLDPNDPAVLAQYVPDGLHPNDAGHIILAGELRKFLEGL